MQANGDQLYCVADVCEINFMMDNQHVMIHITLSFILEMLFT